MIVAGKVFCMPRERFNDINTDEILSGPFMRLPEKELSTYAFNGIISDFKEKVSSYNILVAGNNMGCGSSREQAPKALKGCGIKLIIAKSFGYIFYRNAINLGLALIKVDRDEDLERLSRSESLEVDLENGIINNGLGEQIKVSPVDQTSLKILGAGGLLKFIESNEAL